MMDQEAIVARVEGDQAYVEVGGAGAGCGRCHEAGGCQSGILGQLFRSKPQQFRLANPIGAVPGERVVVRVADGATLRAALLAYAMPVLFLLAGTISGAAWAEAGAGSGDAAAALGGLVGFAIGVLTGLTLRKARIGKVAEPILVRRSTSICLSKEFRR